MNSKHKCICVFIKLQTTYPLWRFNTFSIHRAASLLFQEIQIFKSKNSYKRALEGVITGAFGKIDDPVASKTSMALYSLATELNSFSWPRRYFLSLGRKMLMNFQGHRKAEATVWKRCYFLDINRVGITKTVQLCCHHVGCCSKIIQAGVCFPCRCLPDRQTTETGRSWLQKILLI